MYVRQGLRHDRTRMTGGAIWHSLAHTKRSVDVTPIYSCLIIIFMYKKDVFTKKKCTKNNQPQYICWQIWLRLNIFFKQKKDYLNREHFYVRLLQGVMNINVLTLITSVWVGNFVTSITYGMWVPTSWDISHPNDFSLTFF